MDSERIYTKDEIKPLMKQGAVFTVLDYGDSCEVYWDKESEIFMYKGAYRDSVPEPAMGALNAAQYRMIRNFPVKRLNPWSV